MVVKKDGRDKLENLVFEIFTPFIYRAQILPAAGVPKTQLLLPDMLFCFQPLYYYIAFDYEI
jgi:hypothetical protein